eukprot:CAMPEP_0206318276 /NCGR_PEP_ID=MMETSP0106_2-20121207/17094_1 /ASSEMBLY_ACC=CAM_ASM_000206 /TAXON_ID=81532 /ORGANISM="Acanthoeca-like sp., Strain 10tr" /LENGTH=40 /DNA_ID= /DNA_START= /DNA_END= /DNA_ORIENTATION=
MLHAVQHPGKSATSWCYGVADEAVGREETAAAPPDSVGQQ